MGLTGKQYRGCTEVAAIGSDLKLLEILSAAAELAILTPDIPTP